VRALCDPAYSLAARLPTLPRVSIPIMALDRISDAQAERLAAGLAALGSLTALHCTPVEDSSDIRGPPAWRHLALLLASARQLRSVDLTGLVDACTQYGQQNAQVRTLQTGSLADRVLILRSLTFRSWSAAAADSAAVAPKPPPPSAPPPPLRRRTRTSPPCTPRWRVSAAWRR